MHINMCRYNTVHLKNRGRAKLTRTANGLV